MFELKVQFLIVPEKWAVNAPPKSAEFLSNKQFSYVTPSLKQLAPPWDNLVPVMEIALLLINLQSLIIEFVIYSSFPTCIAPP